MNLYLISHAISIKIANVLAEAHGIIEWFDAGAISSSLLEVLNIDQLL